MKKILKIIGIIFVIAVVAILLVRTVFTVSPISAISMHGVGMAPTYNDGDALIINKSDKQISRGDVVLFQQQKNGNMLKRIVGLPSEKIEIHDGKVFINDAELREDYHHGETLPNLAVTLTNDQYFVLGDNRPASADSRMFGPINRSSITAKVSGVLHHASK